MISSIPYPSSTTFSNGLPENYGVETEKTSTVEPCGPVSHTVEVRDEADREPEKDKRSVNGPKTSAGSDLRIDIRTSMVF